MKYAISTVLVFSILQLKGQQVTFNWVKQLGGTSTEASASIALDNQGNVYTTGFFAGATDFDPGPGVYIMNTNGIGDIFVCKLDPGGNLIWAKQMGGTMFETGHSITIDPAGNVLITGFFGGSVDFDPSASTFILNSIAVHDAFITKLTGAGDHLWTKQFGGPGYEAGHSIKTDANGNVYSTGVFTDITDFNPGMGIYNMIPTGNLDNYISKLDVNGNFLWAIAAGSEGEGGPSLALDNSGNVFVTGAFAGTYDFDPGPSVFSMTSLSGTDIFISKYNPSGNLIWAKKMSGTLYENGYNIAVSINGNVFICGDFFGTVDFDPEPASYNLSTFGDYDIFICKLDPNGNFIWAKQLGGGLIEQGRAIAVDNAENVYTIGNFRGPGDYDPGACEYILNPASSSDDIYISILDFDGNFISAKRVGGISIEFSTAISVNATGDVYITGYFENTVDFDPGQGMYNLTAIGNFDIFFLKLSACTNSSSSNLTVTSCGAFTLGCNIFTSSGTYTVIMENAIGCDSIISLDLTIGAINSQVFISTCSSYQFNVHTLSNSGIYYDTIITFNGCDSIIQLNLTITPASTSSTSYVGCVEFNWNGQTLTTSGVYKDTLVSSTGCDSIATLNLTILPSTGSVTIVNSCNAYLWNGNLYSVSGNYRDTFVSNAACDSIAVLQLSISPAIQTVVTQSICAGQSFEGYFTTGIFKDSFLTANGCDSIRTLNLSVIIPPSPDLGPDTGLCPGDTLTIFAGQFTSFQWQDGSSKDHIIARNPGSYSVVVSNSCGTGTDEIIIGEGICNLYFPSAFTPNQDGKNDIFKALGNPSLAEYSLVVFNRWGEKIFSTKELSQGWNGSLKGRAQPTGAYAWFCVYRKTVSGEKMIVKGTIMLIR